MAIEIKNKQIRERLDKLIEDWKELGLGDIALARHAFDLGYKTARKELFDKFDKYACIKNDKWYLELKEEN